MVFGCLFVFFQFFLYFYSFVILCWSSSVWPHQELSVNCFLLNEIRAQARSRKRDCHGGGLHGFPPLAPFSLPRPSPVSPSSTPPLALLPRLRCQVRPFSYPLLFFFTFVASKHHDNSQMFGFERFMESLVKFQSQLIFGRVIVHGCNRNLSMGSMSEFWTQVVLVEFHLFGALFKFMVVIGI